MMDSTRLQNPSLLSTNKGQDETHLKASSALRIKALQHFTKGPEMEKAVFVCTLRLTWNLGFLLKWHRVC